MKSRTTSIILKFLLGVGLILTLGIGYGIYWAFFDMDRLPNGDLIAEQTSPNGTYTLRTYLVNGHATTPYTIRGELVSHHDAGKTKNIYWNKEDSVNELTWLDEDTVVINGRSLDVAEERFDYRNDE